MDIKAARKQIRDQLAERTLDALSQHQHTKFHRNAVLGAAGNASTALEVRAADDDRGGGSWQAGVDSQIADLQSQIDALRTQLAAQAGAQPAGARRGGGRSAA